MKTWFGPLKTLHNPPPEALEMTVSAFGPMKKGDVLRITIPVADEMVLTKGTELKVTVNIT